MDLHRTWWTRLYGPVVLLAAVVLFLGPTLILPAVDYEFMLGNWVAYPMGVVALLVGGFLVHDAARPFLLRFDAAGVAWRVSGRSGAVPWGEVVRFAIEKKPDEPPRVTPRHLTLWLRHPVAGAGEPDVRLDGLVGYRLADVSELVEPAGEIVSALRRYVPAGLPDGAAGAARGGGGGLLAAPRTGLRPPAEGECATCGSAPAAFVTLRSIVSVAVFHWTSSDRGWFCRDCALATYRRTAVRTLAGCWWGIGVFGAPFVLVANRLGMRAARRLDAPRQAPEVTAPARRPLDPGRPLMARPVGTFAVVMAVVTVVVVVVVLTVVVGDILDRVRARP